MKRKKDIFDLTSNLFDEVDDKYENINIHLNQMYFELCDVYKILKVYDILNEEIKRLCSKEIKFSFTPFGALLYDSLVDNVILGLSRVFVGNKDYYLLKTINVISQMDEFKGRDDVKKVIDEIEKFFNDSEMISIVTTYRDKIFAHIDKECIVTDCRLFHVEAIKNIDENEVYKGIELIMKLWEICFNDTLDEYEMNFKKDDIIRVFLKVYDEEHK